MTDQHAGTPAPSSEAAPANLSRIRPLAGLTGRNAFREILAGITLLAIAVPLNIGYAQLAGAAAALVASLLGGLAVAGGKDYSTLALAQALIGGALFLTAARADRRHLHRLHPRRDQRHAPGGEPRDRHPRRRRRPAGLAARGGRAGRPTAPGVVVIRLAAPLFFANSSNFELAVKREVRATDAKHVVLDMEAVTDVDVTGAESFRGVRGWLDGRRVDLGLSRLRPGLRDRLERLELIDGVSIYDTNRTALVGLAPPDR